MPSYKSPTDAQLTAFLRVCASYDTVAKAAEEFGIAETSARRWLRLAKDRNLTGKELTAEAKLRIELAAAKRDLKAAQKGQSDAEYVARRVTELASRPPKSLTWLAPKRPPVGSRGVPMTIWSDWHYGEVVRPEEVGGVNSFNADVAAARIEELVNVTIDLCTNHMGRAETKYPGMVVCLGGDMITGNIHDELTITNDRTLNEQIDGLTKEESAQLDERSRELGLQGLDAPEEFGGSEMPVVAMVGVNEEMGKTCVDYRFPPDSPNLRMLNLAASPEQREKYLGPYAQGQLTSAIAISEPGGGGDPASMRTRAVLDGDDYIVNGRKIWISRGGTVDFIILMASTDPGKGAKGITAFIVDQGTPGFIPERRIPMLGGRYTWELVFEDMRLPKSAVLGQVGNGYGVMQQRLSSRRIQMAAICCGRARRALDMMREWVTQRKTFGTLLSDRQAIQWWIADAETKLFACRLMIYNTAAKIDQGQAARVECSMIKVYATEMASDIIDKAMQSFGGMGMTKELPLHLMASSTRLGRIYEGPSEVHRMLIARYALQGRVPGLV